MHTAAVMLYVPFLSHKKLFFFITLTENAYFFTYVRNVVDPQSKPEKILEAKKKLLVVLYVKHHQKLNLPS